MEDKAAMGTVLRWVCVSYIVPSVTCLSNLVLKWEFTALMLSYWPIVQHAVQLFIKVEHKDLLQQYRDLKDGEEVPLPHLIDEPFICQ